MIITCTYHTNLDETFNFDAEKHRASIDTAVKAAKKACDSAKKPSFVIGSIGPYSTAKECSKGEEYNGNYPKVDAMETLEEKQEFYREFHKARLNCLLEHEDVDIIGIETVPRMDEAITLVKLISETSNKPFFITLAGG
jgi:S-methylmethionine-dependent homocysteine/selenocysteine methylase